MHEIERVADPAEEPERRDRQQPARARARASRRRSGRPCRGRAGAPRRLGMPGSRRRPRSPRRPRAGRASRRARRSRPGNARQGAGTDREQATEAELPGPRRERVERPVGGDVRDDQVGCERGRDDGDERRPRPAAGRGRRGRPAGSGPARGGRTAPRPRGSRSAGTAMGRSRSRSSRPPPGRSGCCRTRGPRRRRPGRRPPDRAAPRAGRRRRAWRRARRGPPEAGAGRGVRRTGSRPIRPVRSCSRRSSPVIRKPLMTKKTSTPTKPPAIPARPAWNRTTTRTARPRRPSMSGRNPSWVLEVAGVGTITSLELSVTGEFSAGRNGDAEAKRVSQVRCLTHTISPRLAARGMDGDGRAGWTFAPCPGSAHVDPTRATGHRTRSAWRPGHRGSEPRARLPN